MRIKEKNGLEVGRVALFMAFLFFFMQVLSNRIGMRLLSWVFVLIGIVLAIISIYFTHKRYKE